VVAPPLARPAATGPLRRHAVLLPRLCLATLVGQTTIVVTGAAVRLTSSGLGCPTWPRCTEDSYVNTPEYGLHGYVEFGNRLLTVVLGAVVLATVLAAVTARPRRRSLVLLALAQLAGILAQGVVGGITVLTGLNPWTVAAHFLVSVVLIAGAYTLWVRSREGDGPPVPVVPPELRTLALVLTAVSAATLVLGTVVTGSGPHSGDAAAARTGFDPERVSQLHADAVFLLVGLTVAAWLAFRAVDAHGPARAALVLLGVELAQGTVGFVQYVTDLPVLLVGLHVLGACLVWIATLRVLLATRVRAPGPAPVAAVRAAAGA